MKARILESTVENIALVAQRLKEGQVAAIPTETVYGLAATLFNEIAIAKVFKAKNRPTFDPLIVHVATAVNTLEALAQHEIIDFKALSPEAAKISQSLIDAFWPGPFTLVLPKHPSVPDLATSGLSTVAVRMPAHLVTQALLRDVGQPLVAPSANRFGRISPTTAAAVESELGDRIETIVDGGPCSYGLESTVVFVNPVTGELTLLRPGAITRETIEVFLGQLVNVHVSAGHAPEHAHAMHSPGQLQSHYAPRKPLYLLPDSFEKSDRDSLIPLLSNHKIIGLLRQRGSNTPPMPGVVVEVLSPFGNMEEAARNLFARMRALDQSDAEILLAEPSLSNEGLGYAIQDRLTRASKK